MCEIMNEYSDDNVCRICFQRQDTIFSLFRKRKGSSPYDKLVNNTKLKIAPDDGGPSSICLECLTDLDTTINFLNRCEQSNQILAAKYTHIADKKENLNLKGDTENDAVPCISQEESAAYDVMPSKDRLDRNEEKFNELLVPETGQCPECGSKRRCKHWAPPVSHTCQYCQKVFTRKFNFMLHLKRHSGSRDWACGCGALLLTRGQAARHCAPPPRRPCPHTGCTKTFTTNTNLNTHLRTHNGERPYDCLECGKSFSCKNTLNDHMRIHTGVKPYICPVCGKRFATNKLSSHMLSHTVARPHACGAHGCARAFKSRRALTLHAATHAANRRLHACLVCGVRYTHKQSLNKHVKKQHGEKSNAVDGDEIQINNQSHL